MRNADDTIICILFKITMSKAIQIAIAKSMNKASGTTLAATTSCIKTNRLMPKITTKITKEREKKIAPGRLCE